MVFSRTAFVVVVALFFMTNAQGRSLPIADFHVLDLTALSEKPLTDVADRARAWDEAHVVFALQGLVNRERPQLYVFWVGAKGATDRYWLKQMRAPGQWLERAAAHDITGVEDLLARFRSSYNGLVVWDERIPATSVIASTIAGIENLLPVRYDKSQDSLYDRLTSKLELPVKRRLITEDGQALFTGKGYVADTTLTSTGSAKCDAHRWANESYLKSGKCDPGKLAYYPDAFWIQSPNGVPLTRTLLSNHDYFIAHCGFFFDLMSWNDDVPRDDPQQPVGSDFRTLLEILRAAYDRTDGEQMIHVGGFTPWDQKYTDYSGEKYGGVPSEWRYAEILSCFNAYMDADAAGLHAMANASFFQHYPLKAKYEQRNLPTRESLVRSGRIGNDNRVTSRTYVSIYVGDYDSASWLYQKLPELWDDPARGAIPLGWAFNPNLADRFPFGMAWARQNATPRDFFMAGDSGAGYLNPGYLTQPRKWSGLPSGLAAWENHCSRYYDQWDLSVTGFVIDGFAPYMSIQTAKAYSRFSSRGFVAQQRPSVPNSGMIGKTPFIRMTRDLDNPEEGIQTIASTAPPGTGFAVYRTILWTPTQHKQLYEGVQRLRPDIEFVEPHTLMLLLKTHLEAQQPLETR